MRVHWFKRLGLPLGNNAAHHLPLVLCTSLGCLMWQRIRSCSVWNTSWFKFQFLTDKLKRKINYKKSPVCVLQILHLKKGSKEEKAPVPHPHVGKEHQWPSAAIPIRAESLCRHETPGPDINTAVRKDHNYCCLLMILISREKERQVNHSSVPDRFH